MIALIEGTVVGIRQVVPADKRTQKEKDEKKPPKKPFTSVSVLQEDDERPDLVEVRDYTGTWSAGHGEVVKAPCAVKAGYGQGGVPTVMVFYQGNGDGKGSVASQLSESEEII